MSSKDPTTLKRAAALILKGGTLTNEQCNFCGGPQVRFEDKLTCISCGKDKDSSIKVASNPGQEIESTQSGARSGRPSDVRNRDHDLTTLVEARKAIEDKIRILAIETGNDQDLVRLKEKAELISVLVEIVEKIGRLMV